MQQIFTPQLLRLLIATLFYMGSLMLVGPVMAGFCAALGGSGVMMGLVGGVSNFASLLCRPFLGNLIDRNEWRAVGMAGLLCMGLGTGICAASPSVEILLLGRVLAGIGFAVTSGTLSTWVATSLPAERLGQGMGLYAVVQAIAQALAPAIGLQLTMAFSYRAACAVSSSLALFSCLLIAPLQGNHRGARGHSPSRSNGTGRRFLLPELLPIALIVFLFCVPYNGISAFLATVAGDRALPFSVGSFFTIYASFLLAVRLLFSRAFDRIPFRKFVWFSIPFGVVSMLCLQWMRSQAMMVVAAFLLTFAYGIMQPLCQSAVVKSASAEHRGLANCTYYVGLDLGLAFGATLSGALYQLVGSGRLFSALACIPLLVVPVLLCFRKHLTRLGL